MLRKTIEELRAAVASALAALALLASSAAVAVDYSDIEPILQARCVICHAGAVAPLGLRLDSRDGLVAGSSRGAVVVAGNPAESELILRIRGTSLPRMPMTGPPYLANEEVALFEQWILDGMPAGSVSGAPEPEPQPEPSPKAADGPVRYDQVAPIFATRCVKCHTHEGLMGDAPEGYVLSSYADTLNAADRARVVPGHPEASELLRRIRGQAVPRMPFDGPPFLTGDEIALVEQWIRDGARDSTGSPAPIPVGSRVRLHGRLESASQLDDLPLVITRSTRRDKSPGPGDYVRVRGTLDADGRVIVDRLRARDQDF